MAFSNSTYDRLVAFAAGELSGTAAAEVEAIAARDPEAAAVIRRFRLAVETGRRDDSVAPPADVLSRARALFASRPAPARAGLLDALRRIIAELVYDSRLQPALAGVRGVGRSRQLSFESELADIDVEIEPLTGESPERLRVSGQIARRGGAPAAGAAPLGISLAAPGSLEALSSATADPRGMFSMNAIPGRYDLLITVDDAVLVLPGVTVP